MRELSAVVVGALVGTALRLIIDIVVPQASTLIVNTLGSLALGFLVARAWPVAPAWLKAGLGAGLLGSFTTFSAVAVSLVSLSHSGQWMSALAFLAATIALGFGAAGLGLRLGARRQGRP